MEKKDGVEITRKKDLLFGIIDIKLKCNSL